MQEIHQFKAEGQEIAIGFLKSFITDISIDDIKKEKYAKIISSSDDTILFECTQLIYQKISKKMSNIPLSIVPI